jgi:hypothetical protein
MKTHLKILNNRTTTIIRRIVCVTKQYLPISNNQQYLSILIFMVCFNGYSQTLDTYLDVAVQNNPVLEGAFKGYQASLEKSNKVTLENQQLNIGFFTRQMELLMGNQSAEA